jgi:FkbM family methyltransferase
MLFNDIGNFITTPIRGAIHIGAHHGQESQWYSENNISPVVWIECNKDCYDYLKNNIKNQEDKIIIECIGNINQSLTFKKTNNEQSSSLLNLGTHKDLHPDVFFVSEEVVITKRFSQIVQEYNIEIESYNFLNIDIQGYELEAIKSFDDIIGRMDYIFAEVNKGYVYENCALVSEIDDYLKDYGFERVRTEWFNDWGDALYIKKSA